MLTVTFFTNDSYMKIFCFKIFYPTRIDDNKEKGATNLSILQTPLGDARFSSFLSLLTSKRWSSVKSDRKVNCWVDPVLHEKSCRVKMLSNQSVYVLKTVSGHDSIYIIAKMTFFNNRSTESEFVYKCNIGLKWLPLV